jgi:hypothetical protein
MNDCEKITEELAFTIDAATKYADKGGKRIRTCEDEWSLIMAGNFLKANNLTIDWCGPDLDPFGYETIWEYCAGEYFGRDRKAREKSNFVDSHTHIMRNGFNRLKEHLFEQFGRVLFVVPRTERNRLVQVITLDRDYVINSKGDTALNIFLGRDSKAVNGQLMAVYRRSAMIYGPDSAKMQLSENLESVIAQPLPTPRQNSMFSALTDQSMPEYPAAA